jgi:hypothetical protein
MTVCELNGKPVFEIKRTGPAALKTSAELYSPEGYFVKCPDGPLSGYVLDGKGGALNIGGLIISQCTFCDLRIGILVRADGSCAIGVN